MTEELRLNNIGLKGIATDPQPWSLPAEFITTGKNYKVFAGALISSGGVSEWSTSPVNFNAGHIIHVATKGGNYWLVAGRSAIYSYDGANWVDISSVPGYGNLLVNDELLWSSCLLGRFPIVNNPQARPEYWPDQQPGTVMAPLMFDQVNTFEDVNVQCQIMRSHKNFLFALNLTENGVDELDSYRWSHPADINGLPATWDETDEAFLAGKASLGGDGGAIIDGRSLRDSFCIYSTSSIDILDYTNDEFVWRRRELSSTVGLLSTNCMVEVQGVHYFLANGDIIRNDGNSVVSIAHNKIRTLLAASTDTNNYENAYVVRNDAVKEIWFCVPTFLSNYADLAFIYNWRDDSWAVRELPQDISFCNYGSQAEPAETWDTLPDSTRWDSVNRSWGSTKLTPINDTVVGVSPADSRLVIIDPDSPDDDYNCIIERTNFPLINEKQVTTITRVYPHIEGQIPIQIQFGSHDYPGSPVRWKTAVNFNPSTDRKIDIRTTGELHAWRFTSTDRSRWSMSGFTIEYERSGYR